MPHGYQHGHARDATSGAAPVDSLPPRPASEPVHWAVASVNSYGRRGCSSISAGNSASGFDGANSTGANGDAHGDSSDNVSQPKDLHALKHWLVMMEDEVHTRKRPRHPDGAHEQAPMAPPLRPAPMPMAPAAGQPIRRDGPVMCSQQQQRPNSGNPVQLPPRGPGGHGGWPTGPTAPPPRRATDTGVMAWQLPSHHNGQISCAPIQRESLGGPRAWAHGSTNAGGVGTRQPAPHQGGQAAVAAPGGGHTGAACGPAGPSAGYQPYASEVQFQPGQQQQQLLLQQQQQQQQQQLLQQQQQQQEMLQQQHRQQRMRQQQQQLQQQQRPQELWPQRQQQGPFVASQVQQQQPAPPAAETHWPHQNGSDQANPSRGSAAPQQLHEQASCHAVVLQGGQEPYAAGSWVQDRSAHGHGALAMQPPCMLQAAHGLQGAGGSASMPQQPSSRHASQPGAGLMQQCSGPVFGAGHNAARQPEPMHQHQQAQMLAAAHPGAPFAPTQVPPQLQQQWHQV
ncbi:hypothetical protein HXX76_011506 [Chlamydomonas incerta]|uniref:Uncharacterized protein n=1 Tax=Chlamydomonas incerta TaxID=51695 RepID=A0A835SNE5_CHLIN|nr:hypothetical protein HXX76_011506 [Chlamydomonas incerta]|eukprot:KAG2428806.1 hypothetical protein HXX76_011506 [Chlamydomonas incerta]